jgi:large conductance mechanosensitive channel
MIKEFKAFITRGSVVDMAIGIIIGVAFGAIINSLVKDVIMPPIGMLLGNVDFTNLYVILRHGATNPGPYISLSDAQAAGAITINYGVFINTIISFLILAAVLFFFIVRPIAKMSTQKKAVPAAAPTTKDCPYCYSSIPLKASRCPNCTSQLS